MTGRLLPTFLVKAVTQLSFFSGVTALCYLAADLSQGSSKGSCADMQRHKHTCNNSQIYHRIGSNEKQTRKEIDRAPAQP